MRTGNPLSRAGTYYITYANCRSDADRAQGLGTYIYKMVLTSGNCRPVLLSLWLSLLVTISTLTANGQLQGSLLRLDDEH